MVIRTTFLLLSGLILAPAGWSATEIHCGRLVDVSRQQVLPDRYLRVENGVIQAVNERSNAAADDERIDLSTSSCIPGLFDAHVHLFAEVGKGGKMMPSGHSSAYYTLRGLKNARQYLEMGFTTVRIMGDMDTHFASIELRDAFARGEFPGPRLVVAPHALSPLGGHSDAKELAADQPVELTGPAVADGVDEIRRMIRREFKYGADWIKVMASGGVMSPGDDPRVAAYSAEEFAAIAEEAHRHQKKVAAHAHGEAAIRMALDAGFDSIEHGTMLNEALAKRMAKQGTYYIPTAFVMNMASTMGSRGGLPPEIAAKAEAMSGFLGDAIGAAHKHDVNIVVGSDAVFSKANAIKEFAALNQYINNSWFVLRAGTLISAQMMDLDSILGSLDVGKQADLVATRENPIDDIAALEAIHFVMKDGLVVRHDSP